MAQTVKNLLVMQEPQVELGNKNSLAFALDIGSLVVIGRFRNLGITQGGYNIQP